MEKSLSLDNIFVMSIIFSSVGVPAKYQHRVLFWGILGALVMRGIMIYLGEALISRFHWTLYIFSLFLIYTGAKMLKHEDSEQKSFKESKLYTTLSKFFHVTHELKGEHFIVKENGNKAKYCVKKATIFSISCVYIYEGICFLKGGK